MITVQSYLRVVDLPLANGMVQRRVRRGALVAVFDLTRRVRHAVQFNITRLAIERVICQIESADCVGLSGHPVRHSAVRKYRQTVFGRVENVVAVQTHGASRFATGARWNEMRGKTPPETATK